MTLVLTEADRYAAWGDPCTANGDVILATVQFEATDGLRGIGVNKDALPAFAALATVFDRYGYKLDGDDAGSYNCRHIGNDPNRPWSAHAWATALDFNWLENPAGPKLIVDPLMDPLIPEAVEALVTVSGDPVYRWGGNWDRDPDTAHTLYDAMHWEVIATPEAIATGIIDPGGNDLTGLSAEAQDFYQKQFERGQVVTHPDGGGDGVPGVAALTPKSLPEIEEASRFFFDGLGVDLRDDAAVAAVAKQLLAASKAGAHGHAGLSDEGNTFE